VAFLAQTDEGRGFLDGVGSEQTPGMAWTGELRTESTVGRGWAECGSGMSGSIGKEGFAQSVFRPQNLFFKLDAFVPLS
jgi:hypothetical protein